jgi:hypothetical protein
MGLMSIFMGIFTVAVVGMFSTSDKTQAAENSSAQLDTAFDRLDKQVRYATAIDPPVAPTTTNTYWSVAFETTDPTPTTTPAPATCTQLRVGTIGTVTQQRLVERTWTLTVNTDGSTSATNLSGWSQLAAGVTNGTAAAGSSDQPFTLPIVAGATVEQLHLRFIATDGTGKSVTTSVSEITFSALNSAAASRSVSSGSYAAACAQAGTS